MAELSPAAFAAEIQQHSPELLTDECVRALHVHYRLLLQWNERISLIGPGTVSSVIEAHYAESLAALALLPATASEGGTLIDIGSGAGFPGLVLAAARPQLRASLVEARERKWAFLKTAVAASGLRAECILGSVDRALPVGIPPQVDWLTLRALKLPVRAWRALASRLTERGRVLVWAGREKPAFPGDLLRVARTLSLPGTHWKRILELEPV